MLHFELYMINIDWREITKTSGEVDKIRIANTPLELEPSTEAGINYKAETFCYERLVQEGKKLDAQLAVKSKLPVEIRRIKSDGADIYEKLYNFRYNNESWWIEKGSWKDVYSYYACPSFQKAGIQTLKIGDETCQVTFAEAGFEPGEFEALLGDFESDLWQILLAHDSTTSAQRYEYKDTLHQIAGSEVLEPLRAFIKNAEQALRFPKVELREQAALQPAATVRPVPRTFMELAVKGNPAKLTGRAYYGSYNTPENRYLAGMIKRLLAMVKSLAKGSETEQEYLKRQQDRLQERIAFLQKGVAIVDKDKLKNQIEETETRLAQVEEEAKLDNNRWAGMCDFLARENQFYKPGLNGDLKQVDLKFKITSRPEKRGNWLSFYVDITDYTRDSPKKFSLNLEFPNEVCEETPFLQWGVYVVKGLVEYRNRLMKKAQGLAQPNEKDYLHILNFQDMKNVERTSYSRLRQAETQCILVTEQLKTLQANKRRYEHDGWQEKLDQRGRVDAEREQAALKKKLVYLEGRSQDQENYKKAFPEIKQKLEKLLKRFVELKVEPSRTFPGSMTYIQNPHYRGCHARFCEIVAKAGIKEDLFDRILATQDFGIVDLPSVYERWCLLQIIKVLTEEYHFEPLTFGWRENLVRELTTGKLENQNFSCNFVNNAIKRLIEFRYQPTWKWDSSKPKPKWGGRRPDFELKVRVPIELVADQNPIQAVENWREAANLVLDAKCKSYNEDERNTSLGKDLEEIAGTRDYGKGRQNYVFVLHRGRKAAIANAITNQEWSAASYYGGENYYDWQPEKLDHKQGGIMLRPFFKSCEEDNKIKSTDGQDDLKRLVGMVLEMGVEDAASNRDPYPSQQLFCIVCGGIDVKPTRISTKSGKGKKYHYTCQNLDCGHMFFYNYCWNISCKNRRLFKHDSYWTYHDTHALSPYNIRCPDCGQFADENSTLNSNFDEYEYAVDVESLSDEERQRVKGELEQTKIKKRFIPDTNPRDLAYSSFSDDPFSDVPIPEYQEEYKGWSP